MEMVSNSELLKRFTKDVYSGMADEDNQTCANRIVCLMEDIAMSLRKIAACEIGAYVLLEQAQAGKEEKDGTEA